MTDYVWLYIVTTVELTWKIPQLEQPRGWEPGWKIGDILVETEEHSPEWHFGRDDPTYLLEVVAVRVGGKMEFDGTTPQTGRHLARLLALVSIGANQKIAMNDAVKLFAEEVSEQVVGQDAAVANFRLNELEKQYTRL